MWQNSQNDLPELRNVIWEKLGQTTCQIRHPVKDLHQLKQQCEGAKIGKSLMYHIL
jgi:hypothetical protein